MGNALTKSGPPKKRKRPVPMREPAVGRFLKRNYRGICSNYFFSSFLLHFSQTFPSLAALTQQGCSHVLPSFLALSQQDSAALTIMTLPKRARAVRIAVMDF